jgi:hypothetical protein
MTSDITTNRRRLVLDVRDRIAAVLTPPLADAGFRFHRRDAVFRRDRAGVAISVQLGLCSRPASLGRVGILIQPVVRVSVPEWTAEAERRLRSASSSAIQGEAASTHVVWQLLDWLVPGKTPHWILSDAPAAAEISAAGVLLATVIEGVALPFIDRLATTEQLLGAIAGNEIRLLAQARFTIACGAILHGQPDLASAVIGPFGTARRRAIAGVLGVSSA